MAKVMPASFRDPSGRAIGRPPDADTSNGDLSRRSPRMSEGPATDLFRGQASRNGAARGSRTGGRHSRVWRLPPVRDEATSQEGAWAIDELLVRVARGKGALDVVSSSRSWRTATLRLVRR